MDWSVLLFSFAGVVVLLPALNLLAFNIGWLDTPGPRKLHDSTVPLTGGTAIIAAVALTFIVLGKGWVTGIGPLGGHPRFSASTLLWGLAAGTLACFSIGIWDDRSPLRARYRLMAQAAACIAAVLAGNLISDLGTTFSPFSLGLSLFAAPMTIVAMIGLVNAYNMSDGLDGLCGSYAVVALAALGLCAVLLDIDARQATAVPEVGAVILAFFGAVCGFLVFNLRHPWRDKAACFLGDAGSMAIGFVVAWLAVRLASGYNRGTVPPVTAVWIVALPLIDMFACMLRRPLEGLTPMSADRRHLHHLLLDRGLSVRSTVCLLGLLAMTFAALGIAGWRLRIPDYWMFWSLVGIFICYAVGSILYWRRKDRAPDDRRAQEPAAAPVAVAAKAPGLLHEHAVIGEVPAHPMQTQATGDT